jgi:hypothetical protein
MMMMMMMLAMVMIDRSVELNERKEGAEIFSRSH